MAGRKINGAKDNPIKKLLCVLFAIFPLFFSCYPKKSINITILKQMPREQGPGDFEPADDPHRDFDYTTLDAQKQIPTYINDYGVYFFDNWVMQKIPTTERLGDSIYWKHYIIFDIERSASKLVYNTENGVLSDVLSPDQRTGATRVGFFPLETGGTDLLFYLDGIAYQLDPVTLKTMNRYVWEKTEDVYVRYGYLRGKDGSATPWKDKRWKPTLRRYNSNPYILHYITWYYDDYYFLIELSPTMENRTNFFAYNGVNDQFVFIINNTPPETLDDFTIDYTYKIQRNGLYMIDENFNLLPIHLNDSENRWSNGFDPIAEHFEDILIFRDASASERYLLFDSVSGMTKLIDIGHIDYIEFTGKNKLIVRGSTYWSDTDRNISGSTNVEIEINFNNRNTPAENIGRHIHKDTDAIFSFQDYLYTKFVNPIYRNKRLYEVYNKNIIIEYEMSDEEMNFWDEITKESPDSMSLKYNIPLAYNEKINRYLFWADNLGTWLDR